MNMFLSTMNYGFKLYRDLAGLQLFEFLVLRDGKSINMMNVYKVS